MASAKGNVMMHECSLATRLPIQSESARCRPSVNQVATPEANTGCARRCRCEPDWQPGCHTRRALK